ncbi:hypothetical protein DD829_19160 [Chryseobacterium sp. HMWF035]|nr:hypothetical protein DD829_19160 [Chryseobacterium sp. HMWF035]
MKKKFSRCISDKKRNTSVDFLKLPKFGIKIIKNLFKLISELTAKGTKDNVKANFQNNQSAQKNKNQRFLKTIVSFFTYNDQL